MLCCYSVAVDMSGSNLAILREFSNVEMGVTKKKMSLTGQISHITSIL